jgi:hypothetical protein
MRSMTVHAGALHMHTVPVGRQCGNSSPPQGWPMGQCCWVPRASMAVLLAAASLTPWVGSPGGIVDKLTAGWRGPVGWPFECPLKTRLIWMPQQIAETGGSRQMPQGPLLGQGDLGMTVLSDEGQYPSGNASGEIAMMLGANQMWALSDNNWRCAAFNLSVVTQIAATHFGGSLTNDEAVCGAASVTTMMPTAQQSASTFPPAPAGWAGCLAAHLSFRAWWPSVG